MTSDQILDLVLVPRPNGSEALERVAAGLAALLERQDGAVELQAFTATPYGFRLCWSAALALMLGYLALIANGRHRAALTLALAVPILLLLEFELLYSPLSGLLPALQHNVVATWPGAEGGPLLVFSAHYDTTTHFGDHRWWGPWGWGLGPAVAAALALAGVGAWRGRLPRRVALPVAGLALLPFAAMAWFQAAGPLLGAPSPGALDNGGSVTALVRLAERLAARPPDAATSVALVFVAAEEERALGSAAYAATLDPGRDLAVVNLESVGAPGSLAYVPEDGFELRRWRSPPALVAWLGEVAEQVTGAPLRPLPLPLGTLTDGRSFLARGIPAVTLRATVEGSFPRHLHSARDSRERLSVDAIERSVDLLEALVREVDADPQVLDRDRLGRDFRS